MSTPVRQDSACTAVKLLAWNLTQYRRVLLSDSDVLLRTDPASWMMEQTRRGHYFIAEPEMAGRGYLGLNTHLVYLEPSAPVFELLRTTAVYGSLPQPDVDWIADSPVGKSVLMAKWDQAVRNITALSLGCGYQPMLR